MDGRQFDRYVEALGRVMNRRGVLGVLAGLIADGVGEVAAKNNHKHKHHKKHKKQRGKHQGGNGPNGGGGKHGGGGQNRGGGNQNGGGGQRGADASCNQQHKTPWCHCNPDHCNVICIDLSATEPPYDPEAHNAHGDHMDDYICGDGSDCQGAAPGDTCGLACGPMAPPFSQGFETTTTGWFGATRVASGTHNIPSNSGSYHAEVAQDSGAFTQWGRYSDTFAAYTTEVAIYLIDPDDLAQAGVANDTRFDYTSAINDPTCTHRRDFVFNVGYYNDAAASGTWDVSGPRYVISGGNNATPAGAYPKNPGHGPIAITTAGWYTFRHRFYDAGGGDLAGDLTLIGPSVNKTWTRNCGIDPDSDCVQSVPGDDDIIGDTVGGNRYGWFPYQKFPFLAIDTTSRT